MMINMFNTTKKPMATYEIKSDSKLTKKPDTKKAIDFISSLKLRRL